MPNIFSQKLKFIKTKFQKVPRRNTVKESNTPTVCLSTRTYNRSIKSRISLFHVKIKHALFNH